jgi:V/A-type H+-transporting ATPase subunit A
MAETKYYIEGVNGPVVTVKGGRNLAMMDMVSVGPEGLIGEVVSVENDVTTVQVYEDTTGLTPGMPVTPEGAPMSITLGPGLLNNIYDGICRPLRGIADATGAFIGRGIHIPALDIEKKWDVTILVKPGDTLAPGQVYAECDETPVIRHRSMMRPDQSGTVVSVVPDGQYTVADTLITVETASGETLELKLAQQWPIRTARPVQERCTITKPLVTGQRIIDTLFPLGKGGCAAIPGPFGAGKTVTQHQLAKWSDADLIVYLGCGERGNEMTQVLDEFSELIDPHTNQPLMYRTVLLANTSNMPVAAREASIYTGMTIAEYYRDMGYHVAMMADSTSRWAEALREISGRLEEMPAEEGFPAYLSSRLAEFYERAGYMKTLSGREGSITVIGAVSPQGGDFSEPVTQNTKRFIRTFWALDRSLAYARHFPAINWNQSYSEYLTDLTPWYEEQLGKDFMTLRARLQATMKEETSLNEIVKLIGSDILPEDQKLTIEIARVIRLGFLQQNSFHAVDTYVPMEKMKRMMEVIFRLYDGSRSLIAKSIPLSQIKATGIFEKLIRAKYDVPNDDLSKFDEYDQAVDEAIAQVAAAYK